VNNVTRGNRNKLSANNCRINVRQHYFAERVVSVWNSLSPSVVDFSSLSAFKRTIHNARLNFYTKYWQHCCIVHMLVAVRPFVYVLVNKKTVGLRVYNLLITYKRHKGWCFCWTVSEGSLWYDGTHMCGRFEIFESARHFRIENESGHPIRIRIESRSFAGP